MARESIPIEQARRLYDRLGTWSAVAKILTRRSGQPFLAQSIVQAVRAADLKVEEPCE